MSDNKVYELIMEAYENWRLITCNNNPYPGILFVAENGEHWKPWMKVLDGKDPINQLMWTIMERPIKKRPDLSKGTLYVAGNLTDEFITIIENETTINKIVYYSNEDYANKDMHNRFTFERVNEKLGKLDKDRKWWTHEFYENAYEIVKDRKWPVCLPCYNRPELPAAHLLEIGNYTEDLNYDWYIFVRETQRKMYEDATKEFKYLHIIDFPDDEINNAGAVRRHIQDYVNNVLKKPCCFEIDDDTQLLTYLYDGFKENGDPKSEYRAPRVNNKMGNSMEINTARVFAMWQLAMEEAVERDNVVISCGMPIAFSWKNEYCQQYQSYQLSRGAMTQVVCFNVKKLCEEGIYHKNNADCGFDDIDFTIRCLDAGLNVCCFPWLVEKCEPLGQGAITGNLEQRFINNNNKLKELHSDKPSWVKFREKRKLDQCCIYFPGVRKMQLERGFWKDDEYQFNIYNNGKLIGKEI